MSSLLGGAIKNGTIERPKDLSRSGLPGLPSDNSLDPSSVDSSSRSANASQRALHTLNERLAATIPAGETRQLLSRYLDIVMRANQLQRTDCVLAHERTELRAQAAQICEALTGGDRQLTKQLENFGGHLLRCAALFTQASASDANPRSALQIEIQTAEVLGEVAIAARIFHGCTNADKSRRATSSSSREHFKNLVPRDKGG